MSNTNRQANISDNNIGDFKCVNRNCRHLNTFDWGNDSNYFITFPLQQQLRETIVKNPEDFTAEINVNYGKTTDIHS